MVFAIEHCLNNVQFTQDLFKRLLTSGMAEDDLH